MCERLLFVAVVSTLGGFQTHFALSVDCKQSSSPAHIVVANIYRPTSHYFLALSPLCLEATRHAHTHLKAIGTLLTHNTFPHPSPQAREWGEVRLG